MWVTELLPMKNKHFVVSPLVRNAVLACWQRVVSGATWITSFLFQPAAATNLSRSAISWLMICFLELFLKRLISVPVRGLGNPKSTFLESFPNVKQAGAPDWLLELLQNTSHQSLPNNPECRERLITMNTWLPVS